MSLRVGLYSKNAIVQASYVSIYYVLHAVAIKYITDLYVLFKGGRCYSLAYM